MRCLNSTAGTFQRLAPGRDRRVAGMKTGSCIVTALAIGVVGCSDIGSISRPSAPSRDRGLLTAVVPIYGDDGEPTVSYYSLDTEISRSGGYAGVDRPDLVSTRAFHGEYSWQQGASAWDIDVTFPTMDLPFGPGPVPEVDVARVRMTFGSTSPQVFNRSGSSVTPPNTRPQLASDGQSGTYQEVTLPEGGPNQSLAASEPAIPNDSEAAARRRRAAAVERLVVTPETRARVLAQLRESFREARGPGGGLLFKQERGGAEVEITFDPVIGAITRTVALSRGRKVAETVSTYSPVEGALVLSSETTTMFAPDGSPVGTFTKRHSNITIR